jgi:hypothetical protein
MTLLDELVPFHIFQCIRYPVQNVPASFGSSNLISACIFFLRNYETFVSIMRLRFASFVSSGSCEIR